MRAIIICAIVALLGLEVSAAKKKHFRPPPLPPAPVAVRKVKAIIPIRPTKLVAPVVLSAPSVQAPAPKLNPYNVTLSIVVTNRSLLTFVYSLNPTNWVNGLVLSNVIDAAALKFGSNMVRTLVPPRVLSRPSAKSLAAISSGGQSQEIFEVPLDGNANVTYVDELNLQAGAIYQFQASIDQKVWFDVPSQRFAWTSTDPTSYLRIGRVVPNDGSFHEFYRFAKVGP